MQKDEMIEKIVSNMANWEPKDILEMGQAMMRQDLLRKSEHEVGFIYNKRCNAKTGGGIR